MPPKPKLYVQYRPVNESLTYVTDLQTSICNGVSAGRAMPLAQIHLTLIHFGRFAAIYETLKAANLDLTMSTYQTAVKQFVANCERIMPQRLSVAVTGLAAYGPHGKVIVVELATDEALMSAQSKAAALLLELFEACGITNPKAFQEQDYNFQFVAPYRPHITLLKQAPYLPEIPFKAQLLELQLMPFWYD